MSKILGERLLINREIVKEEVTESGIILSKKDDAEERIGRGVVYKTGTDCKNVKDGDTVFFDLFQAIGIEFKGKDYLMIKENNVFIIE